MYFSRHSAIISRDRKATKLVPPPEPVSPHLVRIDPIHTLEDRCVKFADTGGLTRFWRNRVAANHLVLVVKTL